MGLTAALAIARLGGLQDLSDTSDSDAAAHAQPIDSAIGTVTPTPIRGGCMKIMIGCHAASCPDLVPGDTVRAEYIDDAGPQTDVPATRINRCVKP